MQKIQVDASGSRCTDSSARLGCSEAALVSDSEADKADASIPVMELIQQLASVTANERRATAEQPFRVLPPAGQYRSTTRRYRAGRFMTFIGCILVAGALGVLAGFVTAGDKPVSDLWSKESWRIAAALAGQTTSFLARLAALSGADTPPGALSGTKDFKEELAVVRSMMLELESKIKATNAGTGRQIAESNAAISKIQESLTRLAEDVNRTMRSQSELNLKVAKMSETDIRAPQRASAAAATSQQFSSSPQNAAPPTRNRQTLSVGGLPSSSR